MTRAHVTACTRDCPDGCSLVVDVENNQIKRIQGNPNHPYTDGYCCAKTQRFTKRLNSPNRLKRPLLRKGKKWQKISWDEALSLCAENIDRFRREPASILHLRGGASKGVSKYAEDYFFATLGASQIDSHGVCDKTGMEACVEDCGVLAMNDPSDLLTARGIIVWGKKLWASSVHVGGLVAKARKGGATVVSISPWDDETQRFSDHTIRIRPGTDRFLAQAVARETVNKYGIPPGIGERSHNVDQFTALLRRHSLSDLSQRCDVPIREIEGLVEFFHHNHPCATILGYGLQRYLHGAENVRAINALAFITGNMGLQGGGIYYSVSSVQNLNLEWTESERYTRTFPVAHIGRSILEASDPPIHVVWISMGNPVNQTPESLVLSEALKKTNFVVVVDPFLTDTAEAGHLVLPCSMMFEEEDVVGSWGHHFVNHAKAVVSPPPGVKSDLEILSELGRRLNPAIKMEGREFYLRKSLESPHLDTSLEDLRQKGMSRARRPLIAFEGGRFSHPDGRFRFLTAVTPEPQADPDFPLTLLTLIRKEFLHSQILPEEHESTHPEAFVAPPTLESLHLRDGDEGVIVSPLGTVRVQLKIAKTLHPSAVVVRRGPWLKYGWGSNRLVEGRFTDRPDGVAFYGQRVRVERG